MSVTTLCAPGRRRSRVGFAMTETPAIPSTAAATSTVTRRVDTLRTAMRRTAFQPGPSAAPKPTAAGSEMTSAALAAAASVDTRALRSRRAERSRCRRADQSALQRGRVEPGTDLCEHRSCSAWQRRRGARAADRPVPGGVVCVPPRDRRSTSSTPAIATSGLTPPPKASPCEENGATRVSRSFARPAGSPKRDADTQASTRAAERTDAATAGRQPDDRHVETVVEAERSSWERARRRGSPLRPASDRLAAASSVGPVARASSAAAAGDEAVPAVVEVAREQSSDAARSRRRDAASPRVSVSVARGVRRAGERKLPVEEDAEAGPHDDPNRRGLPAQVCGADGERGRSSARAADAAVVGSRRPVVPGRRDDERCRARRRRRRRAASGPVRERGERLGDADDGNARGVEDVAVARPGRPPARARRAAGRCGRRRQSRRPALGCQPATLIGRSDAPGATPWMTARAAVADDRGPPSACRGARAASASSGCGRAHGVGLRVEHVEPRRAARSADVRVREVDAGVEQRDRDPASVEAGDADRSGRRPPPRRESVAVELVRRSSEAGIGRADRDRRPARRGRARASASALASSARREAVEGTRVDEVSGSSGSPSQREPRSDLLLAGERGCRPRRARCSSVAMPARRRRHAIGERRLRRARRSSADRRDRGARLAVDEAPASPPAPPSTASAALRRLLAAASREQRAPRRRAPAASRPSRSGPRRIRVEIKVSRIRDRRLRVPAPPRRSSRRCPCRARAARGARAGQSRARRATRSSRPRRRPRRARAVRSLRPPRRARRAPDDRALVATPPGLRALLQLVSPSSRTAQRSAVLSPEKEKSCPGTRATGNGKPRDRPRAPAARSRRRPDSRGRAGGRPCRTPRRRRRPASRRARREPVVAHVEQQRVPAAGEQADERRLERIGLEVAATRCDRAGDRPRPAAGRAPTPAPWPAESPTSSAPISPGPCVTATALDVAERRPGLAERLDDRHRRARGAAATRPRARPRRSARAARPARRRRSRRTSPVARDDGGGGLVARGLEREDHHPGGGRPSAIGSRHMIRASSRLSV